MTDEIKDILNELLKPINNSEVDHIALLQEVYYLYTEGAKELEPLMSYYLNGLDDVPNLKEKELWNKESYRNARVPFEESFSKLVKAVDLVLSKEE